MEYKGKAIDILKAARKLFAKKGYEAVTTKEISEKAKVNEVTIFRIFKSKEQLFESLIEHIASVPEASDFLNHFEYNYGQYLTDLGNLIHTIFTKNIELVRIELMEPTVAKKGLGLSRYPNQIKKLVMKYMIKSKGYSIDEADLYATTYMSAVHGLCMNLYILKTFDKPITFNSGLELLVKRFE